MALIANYIVKSCRNNLGHISIYAVHISETFEQGYLPLNCIIINFVFIYLNWNIPIYIRCLINKDIICNSLFQLRFSKIFSGVQLNVISYFQIIFQLSLDLYQLTIQINKDIIYSYCRSFLIIIRPKLSSVDYFFPHHMQINN